MTNTASTPHHMPDPPDTWDVLTTQDAYGLGLTIARLPADHPWQLWLDQLEDVVDSYDDR
ncbi:MAG: hypothetical protein ACR2OH_01740 [Microthrixaceae bacterium]